MEFQVAVIPGDGIGPEIVTEAMKVLDQVGRVYGHQFHYKKLLMGGCSIDRYGVPMPCCLEQSEETSETPAGTAERPVQDRKQDFWGSARDWSCLPISVRRGCIRSWQMPAP